MIYDLPVSLDVCGVDYEIRSDYRAVLDICIALSDPELGNQEKAAVAMTILYPAFEDMPPEHYQEALEKCFWFINCGDGQQNQKAPKLMDWEQEVSAYYEIGDCLFAQIVRIRNKKAKGERLDKEEQKWYRQNRHLVDFRQTFTESEKEIFKAWGV